MILSLASKSYNKSENVRWKMNDKQRIKHYKKAIEDIENICVEQNLKYDTTACEVLDVIEKLCEKVIERI